MDNGYDVIGDVHGEGKKLVQLLRSMGYSDDNGYFAHPTRKAVFVGDLIDRGPEQLLAVRTAKAMVDAGTAHAVMGNHEFNAIAFHTADPDVKWKHLRERNAKNIHQHKSFLKSVTTDSTLHGEIIEWFKTFPMWFEQDGLRVVHACWDDVSVANLNGDPMLSQEVLRKASTKGTDEYNAIETLLKGPEVDINPGYFDKDGNPRTRARHAWWITNPGKPIDELVVPDDLTIDGEENGQPWPPAASPLEVGEPSLPPYPSDAPPVIFGHYWKNGAPEPTSPNTACVDYSACKGNDLVAYRWNGEAQLSAAHFSAGRAQSS